MTDLISEIEHRIERGVMPPQDRDLLRRVAKALRVVPAKVLRAADGTEESEPDPGPVGCRLLLQILEDEGLPYSYLSDARHLVDETRDRVTYRLRTESCPTLSWPEIARVSGVPTHTTVMGRAMRYARKYGLDMS